MSIPLTNEQLKIVAPSIFSDTPIQGVSDRYAFVPTHSVLDTFRAAGYYPIMASESKVRDEDNQGYQKHIIQFRNIDNLLRPDASEEYADIVLTNSHNRTSSFIVDLAFFRLVCSNMMVVPSQTFSHHSIIHSGFNLDKVTRAINEVVSYMPKMKEEIDNFKSIQLSSLEAHSLAKAAIDIRFDKDTHTVDSTEFLRVNRSEDNDSSLWTVFNRVQEAMIRGGAKITNKNTNKTFTSKAITAIDTSLKLNKELFSTVQMFASLKEPVNYQIAA
jgi:methionine-rich copper-binding protein CopC